MHKAFKPSNYQINMKKTTLLALFTALLLVASLVSISALTIDSINSDTISPGQSGSVSVDLKNDGDSNVYNVLVSLSFSNSLPFTPVETSQRFVDKIEDGDTETFRFNIKSSNDAKPGDYSIPFVITYSPTSSLNSTFTQTGVVGITISGKADLSYTTSVDTPVIGQKAKLSLKIVNQGFADAKFASVKIISNGYTLLSDDTTYIGTIASDDFETATYDVLFTSQTPTLTAILTYTDFNNQKITKNINLPINVYTQDQALKLGIITKSKTIYYIAAIAIIIIVWFVWRQIQKRRRLKRSMMNGSK